MTELTRKVEFPSSLVAYPEIAEPIMTTEDAKQLLLDLDGQVMLRGRLYRIIVRSAGAGCQRVTLKRWSADE